MSAIESPENCFEDCGSAQLINGVAVVRLDADFIQTVNMEKDHGVFAEPNGDCRGLYGINKAANSFEVHELGVLGRSGGSTRQSASPTIRKTSSRGKCWSRCPKPSRHSLIRHR
jgi:hypothetical protein